MDNNGITAHSADPAFGGSQPGLKLAQPGPAHPVLGAGRARLTLVICIPLATSAAGFVMGQSAVFVARDFGGLGYALLAACLLLVIAGGVASGFLLRPPSVAAPDPPQAGGVDRDLMRQLHDARTLADRLLDSSNDCIKVLDLQGRILSINGAACQRLSVDRPEQIIGHAWHGLWGADQTHAVLDAMNEAQQGRVGCFTSSTEDATGDRRWWDVTVTPIVGLSGNPVRLLAVARNVTALKASKVATMLEVTRVILENGLDEATLTGIVFKHVAPDLRADLCLNFGLDPDGMGLHLVAAPGLSTDLQDRFRTMPLDTTFCGRVAATRKPITLDAAEIASDPFAAPLRELGMRAYTCHPLMGLEGRLLGTFAFASTQRSRFSDEEFAFVQTLTYFIGIAWQRHLSEAALRENRAWFRSLTDAMPQIVWAAAPDGALDYYNQRWFDMTGDTPEQNREHGWEPFVHPDDLAGAIAHWGRCVSTGQPYELEFRLRLRDGSYRWMLARATTARDDGGAIIRWFGTATDIASIVEARETLARSREELDRLVTQRTAELHEVQTRLAHAARMKALGKLAGGIAHDFNNVLQAVRGGSSLIQQKLGDAESVARLSAMISDAAERGAAVTHRLLAFARRSELRTEPVDPVLLLQGMRQILAHTLGAGIGVRVQAGTDLPMVLADKGQLETVLVNLATNARDAMAGHGTVTLGASEQVLLQDAVANLTVTLKAGRYVRLTITDTGSGMDAATLIRVTEPFFTTKPFGQGTGLGLAMAHGFAEQSGGGLHIESAPGRGTTVELWLPATTEAATTGHTADAGRGAAAERHIQMMLVDDDVIVRSILAEEMAMAGFDVRTFETGAEALRELDRGAETDVFVSDMSMPGMDGVTLIAEAQKRRPDLPAILITGLAMNPKDLAMRGHVALLRKPVEGRHVAETVTRMLETAAQ